MFHGAAVLFDWLPLVETFPWNDAAPAAKSGTEGSLIVDRFAPSVIEFAGNAGILGPTREKPPAMELTRAFAFHVLSNHHDVCHRGNVVAGAIVDAGSKAKPLDEYSRGRSQNKASTHDSMYLRLGFLEAMPKGLDNYRGGVVRMNARGMRLDRLHKGAISLP